MCIRNGIEYSCPDGHILLDPNRPFTLCFRAPCGPVLRQCDDVVNVIRQSDKWCIECWMREEEINRATMESIGGEGRGSKYVADSKQMKRCQVRGQLSLTSE